MATAPRVSPTPPPPALASQGGRLPTPKRSLAPFPGAGAAAEFRWNFEVAKPLSVQRGKEKRETWVQGREKVLLGSSVAGWQKEPQAATRAGRWAARTRVQPLTYVCIAKRLLRVHRGAAAGVGRAQQRGQQQEAERQPKAAGRGAHGALGACVRLLWRGLGGRARPSSPGPLPRANFLSSLSRGEAARGERGAVHPAEKKEAWGRRASAARLGSSAAFYGCVCCGLGPSRRFIALRGSSAPPLGGWRPVQAGRSQQPSSRVARAAQPSPEPRLLLCPACQC